MSVWYKNRRVKEKKKKYIYIFNMQERILFLGGINGTTKTAAGRGQVRSVCPKVLL